MIGQRRRPLAAEFFAIALMASAGGVAGARAGEPSCDLELAAPPQTVRLRYDPFEATPAASPLVLQIRNRGALECQAALALSGATPPHASAGVTRIAYEIADARGQSAIVSDLTRQSRLAPGPAPSMIRIAPGAIVATELSLSAARGQIVSPGEYTDALDIGLYRAAGQGFEHTGGGARLAVSITVPAVMRLTLAGGGRKTTLNFGQLAEGAVRSVNLQAYANQGFRLSASSENGGRMLPLDPAAKGEGGWQIPYAVSINRAPYYSLTKEIATNIAAAATTLQGMTIPVDVRIGSIAGQRAGLYRDVITVKIEPGG